MRSVSSNKFVFGMLTLLFLGMLSMTGLGAQQEPVYGGTLKIAMPAEPSGLDPTTNTAAAIDRVVYNNLYEGLVKYDREGNVVAGVAKDWKVSEDGLTYTFNLRKNVLFHNGAELTAEDVKYTLERDMDPDTGVPHPEYYEGIKQVKPLDKYTVQVELKEPNSIFLINLARGDSVILPKGVEDLAKHPVGTGPFKFKNWKRGSSITLTAFEDYYKEDLPYLDEVVFEFIPDPSAQITALKAGDVGVVGYVHSPESAKSLDKNPNFQVLKGVTTGDVILAMNNSRKPFNNPLVRKAIAYAIDRKNVIKGAMFGFGEPIGSHMSPVNPNYIDLTWVTPHDPDKARELLKKAGYPDGFEAVLKLPSPYNYSVRSGKIIADQLSKIEIDLEIQKIEWGQWLSRIFKNAEYDMTIIAHAEAFDISIYSDPGYYFRYDNPRLQEVLNKAQKEANTEKRRQLYGIAQWIISTEVPTVPLFEVPSLPAMSVSVHNWWKNYPIIALDVTEVWVEKK